MERQQSSPSLADLPGSRSAAALRALEERAQSAVVARREITLRLEADITSQLDSLAATLAAQQTAESSGASQIEELEANVERLKLELEQSRAAAESACAAWELERGEWATAKAALQAERTAAEADRAALMAERASWASERSAFASAQTAWEAERAALSKVEKSHDAAQSGRDEERTRLLLQISGLEKDQSTAELKRQSAEQELRAAQEEARRQQADMERRLLEESSSSKREREEWIEERAKLERECEELRQKFELALEDLQRFRSRTAELEQDLARRPESTEADSAELVALRGERDALAQRVAELERAPAVQLDHDAEQQRADLQRRFELAVEDIRELKTKNAELEARLVSAPKRAGSTPDAGSGMDWESQKRRLLATLEGGDDDDSATIEERAKIESTIEITDAVVADKDRTILALRQQLAEKAGSNTEDAEREAATKELLDTDEVIAEYRNRLAAMEKELDGKLRTAELEISVERAKLARNRAELEDLRVELEAQRKSHGSDGGSTAAGTPKRRWLSKLGLSGDDPA